MAKVLQHIQQGRMAAGDSDFEPYYSQRLEASCYEGCILWGTCVVISPLGREAVTQKLHKDHPGISWMKGLARMYAWWGIFCALLSVPRNPYRATQCYVEHGE